MAQLLPLYSHAISSRRPAPFLPTSREEMDALGWEACDVVLITGDAYVDHPSFGVALLGRLLEAIGLRVGIISQPAWISAEPFRALGKPRLYFGVTSGNMDSMVNHYTSDRKIRSDDAYTPNAEAGHRPDRALLVYAQRAREAYPDACIALGGIEASLRRIAHYDYWSDKVRRSVLPDTKADILLYGNAERALVDLSLRLKAGESIDAVRNLRGTAFMVSAGWRPDGWQEQDLSDPDAAPVRFAASPKTPGAPLDSGEQVDLNRNRRSHTVLRLPGFEAVRNDPVRYAHASRIFHLETNPANARALVQRHGSGPGARDVWLNPPPLPLSTKEMDFVYDLPFARAPHPRYGDAKIPAWEMIRFSVNIMRGCFGGCTFCSITEHEGRTIQSRSEASILREIEEIRDKSLDFRGHITDIGGPTANMYRLGCSSPELERACRRLSCVYPKICKHLTTDHSALVQLYRKARRLKGIKHITIGSGVRYDLAVHSSEYVRELTGHHVSGLLKIAPEHSEPGPLAMMMKPDLQSYETFRRLFDKYSAEAGKKQYLVPYFIAAHPGTRDEDMLQLALWMKARKLRADQVQTFLPAPLTLAATMYHTGKNPLKRVNAHSETVETVRGARQRRLHKAFLRWHDPANWPLLREALTNMGRTDLIGNHPGCLVPYSQPREAWKSPHDLRRLRPVRSRAKR